MGREEYISKYFTNIKLEIEHIHFYYVRKSILRALEDNLPKFNGNILDVGCGIMPYRELILRRNKNVTSYTGLDFESSIDPEYALGKPDLFWTGERIPLDAASVDTVIATELFEHCPEPERIMEEILRVLRPGGVLFFTVPFVWNLHVVPFDEYRYTPFAMQRHLRNAGFGNITLNALGRWDASLAQMLALWYQHKPMNVVLRRVAGRFVKLFVQMLIKAEGRSHKTGEFKNGDMITGLSGTAYKAPALA